MGILAKIFGGVGREEADGIRLDSQKPFWEVSGETDFPHLLRALPCLVSENCILYFEGGSPSGPLKDFLDTRAIPERAHVAFGTIWPRPRVVHVPATVENLEELATLTQSCAFPELAIHFHVYQQQSVLLEWHDVFDQEMLLSGELVEEMVQTFCAKLSMTYRLCGEVLERKGEPAA